ncbi:unnamed protein product [Prorocentrum cordatum]|uniref:Uncharacterized protein n=1 Tax=Prorocentrum cordatum TaxID=2364126 RepID=A0ABN9TMH8_9DINO|nr:unnamed protein product [Polarella glacialis]
MAPRVHGAGDAIDCETAPEGAAVPRESEESVAAAVAAELRALEAAAAGGGAPLDVASDGDEAAEQGDGGLVAGVAKQVRQIHSLLDAGLASVVNCSCESAAVPAKRPHEETEPGGPGKRQKPTAPALDGEDAARAAEDKRDVVVNFAQVGEDFARAVLGCDDFDWEGVRRCVEYLPQRGLRVIGVAAKGFRGHDSWSGDVGPLPHDIGASCQLVEEASRRFCSRRATAAARLRSCLLVDGAGQGDNDDDGGAQHPQRIRYCFDDQFGAFTDGRSSAGAAADAAAGPALGPCFPQGDGEALDAAAGEEAASAAVEAGGVCIASVQFSGPAAAPISILSR